MKFNASTTEEGGLRIEIICSKDEVEQIEKDESATHCSCQAVRYQMVSPIFGRAPR